MLALNIWSLKVPSWCYEPAGAAGSVLQRGWCWQSCKRCLPGWPWHSHKVCRILQFQHNDQSKLSSPHNSHCLPHPPHFLPLTWPSVACRIRDCRMCIFAWISLSLMALANCASEDVVKQAPVQAVWRLETLGMSFGWLHYISSSLLNYLRCIHLYCTYSLRRPVNKLFPLTSLCVANTCCDSDLITHKNFIEPDGCNFYCFYCYSNWVVLKTSTVD